MTVKTLASGLSDKLQPNDIIRIYHFLETAKEVPELRFVKVLSVTDSDGVNVDNTKEPTEDEERQQSAMMQGPRREAITMMFLVIANVPLLYFLNKDWFHTLIFTTPGKIALAICAAIILFALTQIMKLSKPIEYGGDGV